MPDAGQRAVMTTAETPLRFPTVDEAARVLRQSRPTMYRKIERGELRAVRLGENGPLRISVDALREHLRPAAAGHERAE
jgi:excisionase family DNA binding protein